MNFDDENYLENLLKLVCDEKSYLVFLDALADDFANGGNGWEQGSVDGFLGAAHAWGNSTSDHPDFDFTKGNPWQRCAWIIFAGKFYA